VVERCVLLGDAPSVGDGELPPRIRAAGSSGPPQFHGEVFAVRDLQRAYARWAFDQLGSHKARTAERLGIDVKTLSKWLAPDE
ncbi:MAG TPA: hypothetical protein VGC42_18225, partial [Kofleriaceae bacterium]